MKHFQKLVAATSAVLDPSGFSPPSIGPMDGFEDPENFNNLGLDVPLPGWTLRVVRDRGRYELWFQTERGKAWHDFQRLLAAALLDLLAVPTLATTHFRLG